ncbi:MAG TPA: hypothetical protein VFT29_13815 [Gemmatimonadaceae bacterium]|nr:hypothetical protein [Gemmatimonadaceae bacterium]
MSYLQVKLGLSVVGVILLLYGIRTDDARIRWIAMGFLAVSVLMRFLPRRFRGSDHEPPQPPTTPGPPAI